MKRLLFLMVMNLLGLQIYAGQVKVQQIKQASQQFEVRYVQDLKPKQISERLAFLKMEEERHLNNIKNIKKQLKAMNNQN